MLQETPQDVSRNRFRADAQGLLTQEANHKRVGTNHRQCHPRI